MVEVPHHLFHHVALTEEYTAARYREEAQAAIDDIRGRGRSAIVVGGSGLYLKALTHGLADLPRDETLREELASKPLDELVAELTRLEPAAAARVNLRNPRYVTRALEIALLTGESGEDKRKEWDKPVEDLGLALCRERGDLYERINQRVVKMLAEGALEEARALPRDISSTAGKAIGLREIQAYLRGEHDLAETTAVIQQRTRRYAKRQLSWFRREACFVPLDWPAEETPEAVASRVAQLRHL